MNMKHAQNSCEYRTKPKKSIILPMILVFVCAYHWNGQFFKSKLDGDPRWLGNNTLRQLARTAIEEDVRLRPRPEELDFLPSHRSPCWKDSTGIHCLPSIFFGGFPKCSTTDVYGRLTRHPRIARVQKALGYWNPNTNNSRNISDLTDYASVFGEVSENEDMLAMDGNVLTFGHPHWTAGGPVPAASLIVQYIPGAKFIVMLRDPVDRLYSNYNHKLRKTPSRNPQHSRRVLHQAVQRRLDIFNNCTKLRGLRHCAYKQLWGPDDRYGLKIRKGLYSIFIKDAMSVIPRQNMIFIRHEDYVKDRRAFLIKILHFLNMDYDDRIIEEMLMEIFDRKSSAEWMESVGEGEERPFSERVADAERWPMWPQTRKMLEEFYKPHNHDLAKLLHDSRFLFEAKRS